LTPLDGDGRVGFSHGLPVVSSRLPACYASALRQGGISSRRQVEKRAESLPVTVGTRNTLDIAAKCFGVAAQVPVSAPSTPGALFMTEAQAVG
jgi:hypothetical protein